MQPATRHPITSRALLALLIMALSHDAAAQSSSPKAKGTEGARSQKPAPPKGVKSAKQRAKAPKIEYPRLLKFVPAPYPEAMKKAGREGVVKLTLNLDEQGKVVAVQVVQSAGKEFDEAAKAAALKWKFVPAKLDGKPIPAKIPISYPFRLKGKKSAAKATGSTGGATCDPATKPGCAKGKGTTPAPASCDPEKDPQCKVVAAKKPVVTKQTCDAKGGASCTPKKVTVPAAKCTPGEGTTCPPARDQTPKKGPKQTPCTDGSAPPCKGAAVKKAPLKSADLQKVSKAILSGVVQQKGEATKLEDAEVAVYERVGSRGFGRKVATAYTDKGGRFSVSIYPGDYMVKVLAPGCFPYSTTERLSLAERLSVRYYVRRKEEDPYTTTIVGKKDRREVTRYSVTLPEIIAIPGTQGDAIKAVQNFPGVARAPFGIGLVIVRGAAPEDTKIYFEGHEIPQLFHFVGLTSVFNSDLLKKIDFIPGNFSPRYGNALGGVIDVTTRKPKSDTYHGYLDMDLWDVGMLIEGPLPGIFKKGSFALSLRRSWIDSVIRPVDKYVDGIEIGVAPVYYDYQAILSHPLAGGDLKLLFFGSDDRLVILKDNIEPYRTDFQKLLGIWSRKWGKNSLKASLSFGISRTIFEAPQNDFNVDYTFYRTVWRLDYTRKFTKDFKIAMGLDGNYLDAGITVRRSVIVGGDDYNDDFRDPFGSWSVTFKAKTLRQAAWLEGDWTLFDRLSLYPGVRLDFWNDEQGSHYTVDPRFTAKYEVIKKKLDLKAGVGVYTQSPSFFLLQKDIGNPNLQHESSIHYSLGTRWQALRSMSLSMTGFYKHLYGLVAETDASYLTPEGEERRLNYQNTGYGRIYGMEFLLKKDNSIQCPGLLGFKKCFGWLSYTLLRSERKDTKDGEWYLFDFDQTHILTAIFSGQWGNGWTFGVRFRFTSGNPTTPYVSGFYNSDRGEYVGIQGKYNSDRLPNFHQLDMRLDKKFVFNRWSLTLYLDVQNVYYNQATEFLIYNFNYTKRTTLSGLPIVPSFGIKGSF